MNSDASTPQPALSRREFLSKSGQTAAAASVLAGLSLPHVHAAGSDGIQLALIGCGGRGSGAVANAMEVSDGGVTLTAMADLFENRLASSHAALTANLKDRIEVPIDRQFIGFDAFKRAIDSLRPHSGDVAMLTGYAGFRPQQLEYAVSRGVNVFMEKSFAVDPPGVRRVLRAAEEAEAKGVKIAAGLMCRHSVNRQELIKRIREGEIGDIHSIRAYRMGPAGGLGPKQEDKSDLEWQLRNFTKFFWVSGGLWSEMDIHQIDEICWLKDEYPVAAHGVGGRAFNNTDRGQNLDSYSVEWTFADGTKAYDVVRYIPKCETEFATFVHGTKRAAQFSGNIHAGTVSIFNGQQIGKEHILWEAPKETLTPWQAQWKDFLAAIREDLPFNQAARAAKSNLAAIMGRAAVHMGRTITWEEAMASEFQFNPGTDTLTYDSEAPITTDENGYYPVPVPGVWKEI
ncbi:MAG: Gfo/Idh/MocA family oxidoreductase [Verrucomicrobiae bacterium]|nr:Gfo/Idh/MocA family oxidoreductase [Verrucomicrobiae bacterium]